MTVGVILLLEDDPAIASSVSFALEREGYGVVHAMLVQDATRLLHQKPFDLAILDVGLPDGNGLDVCRALRSDSDASLARLPVVVLTARNEELDRVLGLELGADDYIAKPFSPRELVARVRALLRRAALGPRSNDNPAPTAAMFEIDEPGQRVRYAGHTLVLTRLEYRLLRALVSSPSRIHSRASLLDAAWSGSTEAGDRTVDTHIKTLRAKLREKTPHFDPIVTHRGLGYALNTEPPR
ncbi:two-component system response regulator CreB [Caenimonas aquaedulcis]|uniref:Two-component system response regulator CreB n=1 Tax=Caenimonas aquaedulcis TaxID=2793270 RepID=A0A931MHW8_9BURK|nr:two-component system response regulator CreB [Caenimonas aquaedulcis]MBG9389372.1 two-component system response regulator CreB [Caenimonas aquaedulcis]